jgi:GrpB-like predicted nucleotidyltransferase (UPF0157 family)
VSDPLSQTPIHHAEYDPAWAAVFERERERLADALDGFEHIEHIGSTSVPGLAAKPIVDATVVAPSMRVIDGWADDLTGLGYTRIHRLAERRWVHYRRPLDDAAAAHVNCHLFPADNDLVAVDLLFREALRARPEWRRRYERVKREAAANHREDVEAYSVEKGEFVEWVLERAREANDVTVE